MTVQFIDAAAVQSPAREEEVPGRRLTPPRSVVDARILLVAGLTVVADLVAISGAYVLAKAIRVDAWSHDLETLRHFDPIILMTIPGWSLVLFLHGLYGRRQVAEPSGEIIRLLHAASLSMVMVVLTAFTFRVEISRGWIVVCFLAAASLLSLERLTMRRVVGWLNAHHAIGFRTIIVGSNAEARALARTLSRKPSLGYEVIGFVSDEQGIVEGRPVLGPLSSISAIASAADAGAVIVAGSAVGPDGFSFVDRALRGTTVRVRVSLGLPYLGAGRVLMEPLDGMALMAVKTVQLKRHQVVLKRSADILGGLLLTIAALPLMLVIALMLLLTSGRPIMFSQRRVGTAGRLFTMYKFRTMVRGAELRREQLEAANQADGVLFKIRDDPRITAIGKRLRRLGLDELPQLFNVLLGDMSLVGPRPALPGEVDRWTDELRIRLSAKPGLTGLWQVSGRHALGFEDYVRYDLFYIENWSLGLDVQILARTLPALLSRQGAY